MRFTFQRKDKWFVDSLGRKRFQITELVQLAHPVIKRITKGKSVDQIACYWHEEYAYDDNPPFRFLIFKDTYVLVAPDDFTPSDIIPHIFQARKADCASGSIFVASLFNSMGCEASVVFGYVSSTLNSQIKFPHAWVVFKELQAKSLLKSCPTQALNPIPFRCDLAYWIAEPLANLK